MKNKFNMLIIKHMKLCECQNLRISFYIMTSDTTTLCIALTHSGGHIGFI